MPIAQTAVRWNRGPNAAPMSFHWPRRDIWSLIPLPLEQNCRDHIDLAVPASGVPGGCFQRMELVRSLTSLALGVAGKNGPNGASHDKRGTGSWLNCRGIRIESSSVADRTPFLNHEVFDVQGRAPLLQR